MPCYSALPPTNGPDTERRRMRDTALTARLARDDATIERWTAKLQAVLLEQWPDAPGSVLGFCWPVQNEANLLPLLAEWAMRARPKTLSLALPVVVDRDRALMFRRWHPGAAMVPDRYGIPTPIDGDFVMPETLLIPLNAFDEKGFRIGYGGGYFDRTLATLAPRPLAIGIGFELGRVDDTLPQRHDQRLDWIATEAGLWRIEPSPGHDPAEGRQR